MVSNAIPAEELSVTDTQESEIIGVKPTLPDQPLILYNCYAPPNKALMLDAMDIPMTADCILVGDFNSRSPSWGYKDLDTKGEELEDWQIYNTLHLLIDQMTPQLSALEHGRQLTQTWPLLQATSAGVPKGRFWNNWQPVTTSQS